jgi:hypothetical protein
MTIATLPLNIFFAFADPSSMFSYVLGLICKISFLLAVVTFISGIFRFKHDPSEAAIMMISAALFALAVTIVNYFFSTAGLPTINIGM